MKLGTYKENGMNVTYFEDGSIWSVMPSSLMTEEQGKQWDSLPDGYKFPEPDYTKAFGEATLEIVDFGSSPPRVLTAEEITELQWLEINMTMN